MAKNVRTKIHGSIEYKMPVEMAENLLKKRKGVEGVGKMTPNEYLCYVVNEEFGVKGNCVRVITF